MLRVVLSLWLACLLPGAVRAQENWRQRYAELRAERKAELAVLAQSQAEAGDAAAAAATRGQIQDRDPGREYFYVPDAAADEGEAPTPVAKIQAAYAENLFALAMAAARQGAEAEAFVWLHEVCACAGNHAEARRILGYRLREGNWLQSAVPLQVKRAKTKHPQLPWAAGTFDWVESANYQIASTADEAATREFAARLERWRTVWLQAYYEFWAPKNLLARRLEAGALNTRARGDKHQVILFRDRDQYVKTLAALGVSGVERSTGYYADRQETMFVYHDPQPDWETWLQEQCHQLCQEVGVAKSDPVENSYIWVVEGLGMYFESLVEYPGQRYLTLGGFDARRLQFARIRWLREGYWLPLAELTALPREDFQKHPQVSALYSQAAGLTHFLMLAADGKYRSPFLQLAKLVYAKRAKPDALAVLTQTELPQLTADCQAWLPARNAEVCRFLTMPAARTELALGFGDLQSDAIQAVEQCTNLAWLQLSHTAVGDAIGPGLSKLTKLRQLFVDDTQVGDEILAAVSGLPELEELDLAGTRVTDASMPSIGRLTNLRVLWLGKTAVSDAAVPELCKLTSLELLDVGGTRISREGLRQIQAALPKVKLVDGTGK